MTITPELQRAVPAPAVPARRARSRRPTADSVAIAVWLMLGFVAAIWGRELLRSGVHMQIGAPPLTGRVNLRLTYRVLPGLASGVAGIVVLPLVARRCRWSAVLAATAAGTAIWAVAINLVDGWHAITSPVSTEYAATAARITSPSTFLSTFTTHAHLYNLHTQGHPPAMELILWLVDRAGWHGVGPAATLYITVGSLAGVAALVALRDLAGENRARAAAPFLALFPGAIWLATSADAFFAGVAAAAIALLVVATGRARGLRCFGLACAGGALFGVTAFLSYGLVLLAIIPIVVAVRRRRIQPLLLAAATSGIVFVAFYAAGFSWLAGLHVTRTAYEAGVARRRPYSYFLLADLAAFALTVGPAAAIGLARLRDRATWLLVGMTLAVVALADISGMSKAEVERIWLPFAPWVLLATAAFTAAHASRSRVRTLLAVQVATAIAIQLVVKSPW